jgi:hypothetical protein
MLQLLTLCSCIIYKICCENPRRLQTASAKEDPGCFDRLSSSTFEYFSSASIILLYISRHRPIRKPEKLDPPIKRENKSAKQSQDARAGVSPASRLQDPSRQGYFNLALGTWSYRWLSILVYIANTSKDKKGNFLASSSWSQAPCIYYSHSDIHCWKSPTFI